MKNYLEIESVKALEVLDSFNEILQKLLSS